MNTTRKLRAPAAYRVCNGRLFVNEELVPVNNRILKIGLVAAGLDPEHACGPIGAGSADLILRMERAFLISGLTQALRAGATGRAA